MDASYYFVLETDGVDDGPYRLTEIQRRIHIGLISKQASLVRCGETAYVPLTDPRYVHLLEAPPEPKPEPRRAAAGTVPPVDDRPVAATMMMSPPPPVVAPIAPVAAPMPPAPIAAPPEPIEVPIHVAPIEPPPVPRSAAAMPISPSATFLASSAPAPIAPPIVVAPPAPPAPVPSVAAGLPTVVVPVAAGLPTVVVPTPTPPAGVAPTPALAGPPPIPADAQFPRVAPTVAIEAPLPFPRVAPTVSIAPPVPVVDSSKPPSARSLIAKAKAKVEKPVPLATADTAFIAAPPAPPLAYAPTAFAAPAVVLPQPAPMPVQMQMIEEAPARLVPPPVAVMPRGFVPPRQAEDQFGAEPFAINAEGSAPAPMPMPSHHQHQHFGPPGYPEPQLALPPGQAMQVYDQGYERELNATQANPRFDFAWWKSKKVWAIAGGALALVIVIIAVAATRGGGTDTRSAMVRVTTPSGTGAGFFIAGPDQYAYVATANHVVDRGERILVERDVGADKSAFVEAYPETEIVAADPDADLAIIRIKNVDASRFPQLVLAKEPTKDERILSYGYPGSSLASKTGLVSKDGKILSLVSFPAYDERYQRVLRDNAVDGLLISTDIEPGMSGGPTCNDSGEVVGINVTKDRAHTGQNGAVSVVALRTLLGTIKPAADRAQPTTDDVAKLLEKIQSEYLVLPLDERKKVRETDFVSSGDLPQLRQLVNEVRREERNTDTSFIAKYRLSGQAALGIFFARMPGKLLETYRAPSTIAPIVSCELTNQRLTSFLGDLTTTDKRVEPRTGVGTCDELAVRPLAWDLVAATLQWEGKEQHYTVAKLDKMDEDGKVYRAQVRISGTTNLIELWIGIDRGAPRLKLFDPTNSLYAIKSPRNVAASALQGTWAMKRPRVTDAINKEAEIESSETLSISIDDDRKVSIRHVVSEHYFGAGNRARVFTCNGKKTIETGLLQSFTGTLENGVVVALPDKEAEPLGPDASYCRPAHKSDRIVAVKLAGDLLYLYRTDGNAYPETLQLARDNTGSVVPTPVPAL